jgi:putative glutamine amidotransferase
LAERPIIGITLYAPEPDRDPPAFSLPTGYVEAVAMAGGIPILLAPNQDLVETFLDRIDGLLLSGGGDLDPGLHRGGDHPKIYGVNRERDEFEIALVSGALERDDLPVVGICRGMQIMNVALGGDLILDIPDHRGEAVVHRLPPRRPTRHPVELDGGGELVDIYGTRAFEVCTWHHQEVAELGRGLRPVAHAPDGVIEALVYDEHPFALGVQWHPELQVREEPVQRRLFEQLVGRARRRG